MPITNATPEDTNARKAPPDLTVWLPIGGVLLIAIGAIILMSSSGASLALDVWNVRVALVLVALGLFVMFSVYGLLVAFRPSYVAIGARAIAQRQRHPRRYGLALVWCGFVLAAGFLAMPEVLLAHHVVPDTPAFSLATLATLAAGVGAWAPLLSLQMVDRRRPGVTTAS